MLVVAALGRNAPQTRLCANGRLPEFLPNAARPEKGAIVETGWHESREFAEKCTPVLFKATAIVLPSRAQPLFERNAVRPNVRHIAKLYE